MNINPAVYFTIGIFLLGVVVQVYGDRGNKDLRRWSKALFYASIGAVFLYYAFLTVGQYFIWKLSGPPFSYFLPPHESIFYLLNHHFIRFALYYLITLIISFLFLYFSKRYNKKNNFKFFEVEEPYFGALSVFLLGNPNWPWAWIFYLGLVCLGSFLISLVREKFFGVEERLPLYNLWFPTAILVIIINVVI